MALLADRDRGDARQPAVWDRYGLCAGALPVPWQDSCQRHRSPAVGAAAGRHRLRPADAARAQRRFRPLSRADRHCFLISLDRRGGRLRRHGVSFDGPRHAAFLRGDRSAPGIGVGDLGREPTMDVPIGQPPSRRSGIIVGAILAFAKALGEFGATITFVSNIPGETQTISAAIYSYTQVPGGDESAMRLTIVSIFIALFALTASEIVQWRAMKRLGTRRMIEVDVRLRAGAFSLDVAFANGAGVTALFGQSGSGKSLTLGIIAGLIKPDEGYVRLDGDALVDVERNVFVPVSRRRVGLVFQDSNLFPHLSVKQNLLVRPLVRASRGAPDRLRRRRRNLGDCETRFALANRSVGRRETTGGDRPRVAVLPKAASPGRTAGGARYAAQARDLAIDRTHQG